MVKISLKKESKVKKQKQKQKQSQKVVVNIGTNLLKPKRRRPTGPIEKKVANKQQTPTINVPQALPITLPPKESMNELINYLKQAEQRKEAIKEREIKKTNELEKEKKEEKRSEVLTRDEVQDNFSTVFPSSNISSLTSGTSTPLLSRPVDHNSLFEALSREADLRSENPNSGSISLSTSSSIPFLITPPTTSLISEPKQQTLDEVLKDTVVTDAEDPVIEQVLEEMPENQIVIYGPQRAGQTATATGQIINPIDKSIPPPPPFRFNKPLPTIRISDIIAENAKPLSLTQISEKERVREARLKALEPKKPLLAIESQTSQADAEDTIKLLENLLKPDKKKEENESKNTLDQEDSPELRAFKDLLRGMQNKDMGNLLIKNKIKGPDGKNYTINKSGVNLGSARASKQYLREALLQAFNEGKITK